MPNKVFAFSGVLNKLSVGLIVHAICHASLNKLILNVITLDEVDLLHFKRVHVNKNINIRISIKNL